VAALAHREEGRRPRRGGRHHVALVVAPHRAHGRAAPAASAPAAEHRGERRASNSAAGAEERGASVVCNFCLCHVISPLMKRQNRAPSLPARTRAAAAMAGGQDEPCDADKTPVTIVTGFLGAGKTTLVNYILQGDHGKKIAVIENEFGEVNIDEALVSENLQYKEDVISMDNGCGRTRTHACARCGACGAWSVCCARVCDVREALARAHARRGARAQRVCARCGCACGGRACTRRARPPCSPLCPKTPSVSSSL
jgi:hypothetical protein